MITRRVKVCLGIMLLCLFIAHTGTVHAEHKKADLQRLLDQASPGETVILKSGTYDGPLLINKPLHLKAEDGAEVILLNSTAQPALTIEADQVTVTGLRIVDVSVKEEPSILLKGNQAMLDRLHIQTGAAGIMVRDANDGKIMRTTIEWAADGVRMADKGNGIDLYNSHRMHLQDNAIYDVHDGIYMENSDAALVTGNRFERSRYGVHCMYTKGTVIQNNTGNLNITGAMIMNVQQVTMEGNTFAKQSENVNSQGIFLYNASGSVITDNRVEGNRVGLYVEQSADNRLDRNEVSSNFIGLQLINAASNTVEGNLFLGNVVDAQARGSESNDLSGNYWDSFSGIDTDGDGRSDIAYTINPFFQGLTQKRPPFQLFFQSPGMVFLEGLYQTERDKWATDRSPLMAPPKDSLSEDRKQAGSGTGVAGIILLAGTGSLFYGMRRRKT